MQSVQMEGINGMGVMAETATAMRDPVFYMWHLWIDDIFDVFKRSLPSHELKGSQFPLLWEVATVESVEVKETGGGDDDAEANTLTTFWTKSVFQIGKGNIKGECSKKEEGSGESEDSDPVNVCVKQLEHSDFQYKIVVTATEDTTLQTATEDTTATLRIFLAPRYETDGSRMHLLKQRQLTIGMDTFNVDLTSGENTIERRSCLSTYTSARGPGRLSLDVKALSCENPQKGGCGWPHNLLLPKSTEAGVKYDLFVMVTDGNFYKFEYSDDEGTKVKGCKLAPMMCSLPGMEGRPYPDRKLPMGYPFDRLPYQVPNSDGQMVYVETMADYTIDIANMKVQEITIRHKDVMVKIGDHYSKGEDANSMKGLCPPPSSSKEND